MIIVILILRYGPKMYVEGEKLIDNTHNGSQFSTEDELLGDHSSFDDIHSENIESYYLDNFDKNKKYRLRGESVKTLVPPVGTKETIIMDT